MRVAVVANPTSGGGKGAKLIPRVSERLSSLGIEHAMFISRGPEDPERLARRAASDGAAVVVALGGDGQIGNCANGVLGTDAALAVVPAGSGNDFARTLGLDPKDPLSATAFLRQPQTRMIDVVRVRTPDGERRYVNVAGVGFDSEVNGLANETRFPLRGTPRYIYAVFVTLARFRPGNFRVNVDGERHDFSGMLIAVGNAPSYGGGMRVTPEARLDDAILDICILKGLSRFAFIRAFPKVFKGTHVTHPAVQMMRGKEVRISADRPFDVYGDGERFGPLPATFTVEPGALRVVVPATAVGTTQERKEIA